MNLNRDCFRSIVYSVT